MSLRDQGYRFVRRGAEFKWTHPAEVRASDLDCTEMSDAEFKDAALMPAAQLEADGIDVTEIEGDRAEQILRTVFDFVPRVRGEKVVALRGAAPDYWALVDGGRHA